MKTKERMRRIRADLGQDYDVAVKVLILLMEGEASTQQIADRLGVDLLEAERLMLKLERLGLVT